MPLPLKRWPVLAFFFASLAVASSIAIAAGEWQVIKVNGHDYLSVDNISKFYGLPAEVVPSGAKIQSDTADHPLEFVSGSREAIINGARSWLCFPVIEQDGKSLVSRTDVAKTIEPLVRPHRVPDVGKVQTVVLDAWPRRTRQRAGEPLRGGKRFCPGCCAKAPPDSAGERIASDHDSRRRLFCAVGSASENCQLCAQFHFRQHSLQRDE